jgi:hypothetical protein
MKISFGNLLTDPRSRAIKDLTGHVVIPDTTEMKCWKSDETANSSTPPYLIVTGDCRKAGPESCIGELFVEDPISKTSKSISAENLNFVA